MKWWQKTIVYEIYVSSFQDSDGDGTGDLKGIIRRLDYLKSLGVGAIWLTPVYPSPMVDNGYDVADYYDINPRYGTMADMERLIAEAGRRGIRIVMDLVFNHSSDRNAWFIESKSNRDNPKADWYIWRDAKNSDCASSSDRAEPTNWRAIFGGSAWEWCEERGQYYLHSFAKEQPDLNWENPEVRKELCNVVKFWLKKGVGGFRMDAMPFINKPGKFENGEPDGSDGMVSMKTVSLKADGKIFLYLGELKEYAFDGHDIFAVVEADGIKADEMKYWIGSEGAFDMLIEFNHVNLEFRSGKVWSRPDPWTLPELKKALSDSQKATEKDGWYPIYFENHDRPRSVNHFFPDLFRTGEEPDKKLVNLAAKALGTILLTLRGTPFLYQGEELGLTNVCWDSIETYDDIAAHGQYEYMLRSGWDRKDAMTVISKHSRDNARTPMQWDCSANAGFTTGRPWLPMHEDFHEENVAVESNDPVSVLSWYRMLAGVRAAERVFTEGSYEEIACLHEHEQIYGFKRICESRENSEAYILVNFSGSEAHFHPEDVFEGKHLCRVLSNYEETELPTKIYEGVLRPCEAVVLL